MKRVLVLITVIAVITSGCAETPRSVGEIDEIIETSESVETTETPRNVGEIDEIIVSRGTLWETDIFSMMLGEGWSVLDDEIAVYGESLELNVFINGKVDNEEDELEYTARTLSNLFELIRDPYYTWKEIRYIKEIDIDGNTFVRFVIVVEDPGGEFDLIGYVTYGFGNIYNMLFTLPYGSSYTDYEEEFDGMMSTFTAKPYTVTGEIGDTGPLNTITEEISAAIEEWIAEHKDEDGFPFHGDRYEQLILYVDEEGNFRCACPDSPLLDGLCETLTERFTNMYSTVLEAVIDPSRSVYYALLYDTFFASFKPEVTWDWDNNKWIAEGALADGVDANGVPFGSYPPHKFN